MRKFVIPLIVFLFVCFGVNVAAAQWHDVGSNEISDSVDHETITVKDWSSNYKHARLGVTGTSVEFVRVVITYGSGITEDNWVNVYIKAGEFSPVKDLATGVRLIRKVEVWYVPESLEGQKAVVTLYARE
jgi:hypothetical protein